MAASIEGSGLEIARGGRNCLEKSKCVARFLEIHRNDRYSSLAEVKTRSSLSTSAQPRRVTVEPPHREIQPPPADPTVRATGRGVAIQFHGNGGTHHPGAAASGIGSY